MVGVIKERAVMNKTFSWSLANKKFPFDHNHPVGTQFLNTQLAIFFSE